jgi:kynurenine formamidase
MLSSGLDAEFGPPEFPHGIGGADDVVFMPLQASTQWDGLGHIFDHGMAYNGRRASAVVTSEGDQLTGIETVADRIAGRGVLLDVGRAIGTNGELPDGFAITTEHLEATIAAHGESSRVGRGDLLLVRTGQMARTRRDGWGDYAGGPAPGLSFTTADWLHTREIAGIATDTWGFEVRPNEFDRAFQPLHQVAIPHMGLFIGEIWDLDALAADCAADGIYDFFLTAAPPSPSPVPSEPRSTPSPSSRAPGRDAHHALRHLGKRRPFLRRGRRRARAARPPRYDDGPGPRTGRTAGRP